MFIPIWVANEADSMQFTWTERSGNEIGCCQSGSGSENKTERHIKRDEAELVDKIRPGEMHKAAAGEARTEC